MYGSCFWLIIMLFLGSHLNARLEEMSRIYNLIERVENVLVLYICWLYDNDTFR